MRSDAGQWGRVSRRRRRIGTRAHRHPGRGDVEGNKCVFEFDADVTACACEAPVALKVSHTGAVGLNSTGGEAEEMSEFSRLKTK